MGAAYLGPPGATATTSGKILFGGGGGAGDRGDTPPKTINHLENDMLLEGFAPPTPARHCVATANNRGVQEKSWLSFCQFQTLLSLVPEAPVLGGLDGIF